MRSRLLCEHFRGIVFVVFDGSVDEFSLVEVSHVFWVDFGFWVWFKGSVQGVFTGNCSHSFVLMNLKQIVFKLKVFLNLWWVWRTQQTEEQDATNVNMKH
ncbi:hypothetical protein Droror1_Dr00025871 [Drosera rotundifolia]